MTSQEKDGRAVCFVIMGFGKKTDFESGRTLDLDATYEAIISPAVATAGLRCIRADEVMHTGVIDTEMYELLLRAELVIADISTGNANAVYELGVRHALCPNSTIIMSEQDGKLHFDLNHTSTFRYEHLGKDIGAREAGRAKEELCALIRATMESSKPDSPVYTYLPKLRRPQLTNEQYEELLDETEATHDQLSGHLRAGEQAQRDSRHKDAAAEFALADKMKPGDSYIVQQLALSTYKAGIPSKPEALFSGKRIIESLDPSHSNDPETLGIAGAIYKRLWLTIRDGAYLDDAIRFYQRGFEIRRDYYNGENLAVCLAYRARTQTDLDEKKFDSMSAKKVRIAVIEILEEIKKQVTFVERSDHRWIFATLANCYGALGQQENSKLNDQHFFETNPSTWEIESYREGKDAVLNEQAA